MAWRLEHTYATLPEIFYTAIAPTPVREPKLVAFNKPLAEALGLDAYALNTPEGAAIFAGNTLAPGSRPIAQAYAGHQFGGFTTLGDGRAILLGEQVAPSGVRFDIQLKGSGRTPYSRGGDGRAALGPMLREYVISEAMHALGIPTTRSLAVVTTGEPVFREDELPGAVLTRVAASHIRVGTVQWAAAHRDVDALRAIADYTRARHYAELPKIGGAASAKASAGEPPALALFRAIVERQARLIAQWQLVGFIHGVMNTDNMALSGETIDYGPCAFMNAYDPATVFSSIDRGGRYAYRNQPGIAQWNLTRLAEAMLPLFNEDQARAAELATVEIEQFADLFEANWLSGMRAKLGLFNEEDDDRALAEELLEWMHRRSADFTNTFRDLSAGSVPDAAKADDTEWNVWRNGLEARWARQPQPLREAEALMRRHNPAFIPRNHKVEEALDAATGNDLAPFNRLLEVLRDPYNYTRDLPEYSTPPKDSHGYRTFCGT